MLVRHKTPTISVPGGAAEPLLEDTLWQQGESKSIWVGLRGFVRRCLYFLLVERWIFRIEWCPASVYDPVLILTRVWLANSDRVPSGFWASIKKCQEPASRSKVKVSRNWPDA